MTAQRKVIRTNRIAFALTSQHIVLLDKTFDNSSSMNMHGLRVSMGATPAGPDESMLGRWYLALVPNTVAHDPVVLLDWLTNFNGVSVANDATESAQFILASGAFTCAEQSTFQHEVALKTSRNVSAGDHLMFFMVADAISGVIDDWDANVMWTYFIS